MEIRGKALGVRLANLWLCGRSYLPSTAAYIADVNRVVADAGDDRSAFARTGAVPHSPGIVGDVTGPVQPHWNALRDELQRVLAASAENMYAAADALVEIADAYATGDDTVAVETMERMIGNYLESGDYLIDQPAERPELFPPE